MNSASIRETYEQSSSEHRRLLAGAESLLAGWPHDVRRATDVRPYLIQVLNELRSRLAAHFAAEESPEYLSDAVTAAPRLATRAKELQQQHAEFLAALERITTDIESKALDGVQLADDREVLHQLICDLRRHEQAEDDLLLEAVDDDLGSGD